MRIKVYLKVSNNSRKGKVSASVNPNFEPHFSLLNHGNKKYYPTVQIALDLEIPDKEFEATRILLNQKVNTVTPAVEINNGTDDSIAS